MSLRTGKIFILASLGVLLFVQITNGQSRNPKAVEHLNTAIDMKKKGDLIGAEAHYSFAILLANRGDINGAISESRKAIDIEKNYPEAHFHLAGYYR